ncbi:ATP-grasp domain-containing protein [Bacillus sp. EB01]|uniref:ATP-grasp domain-containing protein n=1 Tax=Bacillus sp. EB01 TaxID=1347086 RepID=UPI0005C60B09|nr:ATP-grasp domain-containing protein [Bacillus sp. EB01]
MKSVVFIETNRYGSSMEGMITAGKLGYDVHLITAKKRYHEERIPEINAVHFIADLNEENIKKTITEIKRDKDVLLIISFVDPFVSLAAKMNLFFCGGNIDHEALRIMENKIFFRSHLSHLQSSPNYQIIHDYTSLNNLYLQLKENYPIVLKSPSSSGSRDVYFIHSESHLKNRIKFLKRKKPNEDLLIEEYLEGTQYIVEAIVYNGEIQIAAIIEQEITKQFKFIVTGYSISPVMDTEAVDGIVEVTCSILKELKFENGNCHLELRNVNGTWKLIEINPRISGGPINKLIEYAYGFNYTEQIINLYLGKKPVIESQWKQFVHAHLFTVNQVGKLVKMTGLEEAQKARGIIDIFIKAEQGQILSPPLSMGHRYGYVIAKGKTKEEARSLAISASKKVKFELAPYKG